MISFTAHSFKLNRILLLSVGLWPLQQSNLTRLQFIFMSVIITTSTLLPLTAFITLRCTPDLVTEILSYVCFYSTFVIQYNLFRFHIKDMKNFMMQLQDVYNGLKDKNEIAIMKEYSYIANCYTTAFTIASVCGIFGYMVIIFWPDIMHIIIPTNVTQPRRLPIPMDYFMDQEKYLYWIVLYLSIAVFIGAISMIATGSILIAYIQCTCGMFKISSYRIRCAMHINMLENIKSKKENLILEGIISAVNIHRQAMKLSKFLESKMETMMLCLIMSGILSLSLNLFRVSQIISSGYDIQELLMPFVSVTMGIIYMFIGNYGTQNVTDHNNDVFATVYDVQWHGTPLHIQKVILFLLQKGAKEFTLGTLGGLFVGSLECFTTLVKTSFSYFTVIYSTQ